jgi:hypothetical protein
MVAFAAVPFEFAEYGTQDKASMRGVRQLSLRGTNLARLATTPFSYWLFLGG